jgi:hypothetical protein
VEAIREEYCFHIAKMLVVTSLYTTTTSDFDWWVKTYQNELA